MFSYFKGHARLPPVLPEELRVVKVVWSIQVFEKVSRKSKLVNEKIANCRQKLVNVVHPWCNMSSTNKSLNWIPNCIQTTRICRECGLRFRIHRNSKIDTNIASSGFEFLFISLSPFFFPFRVSQIDNEFLEFYGSLQLCHESKKRQYFDEWKSIDESPPSQSSLGIEPVIPQVDKEEVSSLSLISPFLSLVTVENVKTMRD